MSQRVLREYRRLVAAGGAANESNLHPTDPADLTHWEATLEGPQGTPYEGHSFPLRVTVPDKYPTLPPSVCFPKRTMPHPNVKWDTGEVCLDTLAGGWTPVMDLQYAVMAVRRLLAEPNPESPLNLELAALSRLGDHKAYDGIIKYRLAHSSIK
ncbi:E2 ubiquitin-protein ligase peroxin 4 KNAG_0B00780 [Huiozyma naganishii CBS 8797]|uniref:UBC core domain-containing protein n=1 Tax=Huiozyma naganishii (strain ATCC MYA-139 / BCRC 22969 / CBS 8797 / KCTC 17520 / NBRC 10181 / NCYC 3082 / Yp74L-3) TaxID=1071383 RepID=J7R161_HUIN7|nr:hypothetical protein KNAG_0B00780 [Kazachstania naganishii CBS 8797]CCK68525.1 hypothetical protein KNAG_0B00780 [Kazachstania naganishii CBS 8797]